jgi:hypothetical protein
MAHRHEAEDERTASILIAPGVTFSLKSFTGGHFAGDRFGSLLLQASGLQPPGFVFLPGACPPFHPADHSAFSKDLRDPGTQEGLERSRLHSQGAALR